MNQLKGGELFHDQSPRKYGTGLGSNSPSLDLQSVTHLQSDALPNALRGSVNSCLINKLGIVHYIYLGVSGYNFQKVLFFLSEDLFALTNSADPDEMLHYAALHL